MKSIIIALVLSTSIFSQVASAWGIAFYSGYNCNEDPNFDNTMYSGEGTDWSDCIEAGEPGPGCHSYKDNGQIVLDCMSPLDPVPFSVRYSTNTECCFGYSPDCSDDTCGWNSEQCIWTVYLGDGDAPPLTFKCRDIDDNKQMKTMINGTHPVDVPI